MGHNKSLSVHKRCAHAHNAHIYVGMVTSTEVHKTLFCTALCGCSASLAPTHRKSSGRTCHRMVPVSQGTAEEAAEVRTPTPVWYAGTGRTPPLSWMRSDLYSSSSRHIPSLKERRCVFEYTLTIGLSSKPMQQGASASPILRVGRDAAARDFCLAKLPSVNDKHQMRTSRCLNQVIVGRLKKSQKPCLRLDANGWRFGLARHDDSSPLIDQEMFQTEPAQRTKMHTLFNYVVCTSIFCLFLSLFPLESNTPC